MEAWYGIYLPTPQYYHKLFDNKSFRTAKIQAQIHIQHISNTDECVLDDGGNWTAACAVEYF